MKLLVLKILNQKILRFTQIENPTPIVYSLIEKDLGKSSIPSQTFTFMIDETDSQNKPKSQTEVKNTVYQEIKQKNFNLQDRSSKKINIKIVDQVIQEQKTDLKIMKQCE